MAPARAASSASSAAAYAEVVSGFSQITCLPAASPRRAAPRQVDLEMVRRADAHGVDIGIGHERRRLAQRVVPHR